MKTLIIKSPLIKLSHTLLIVSLIAILFSNSSTLASEPKFRTNGLKIKRTDLSEMLQKHDFYCATYNPDGKGFENEFEISSDSLTVFDRASGLYWQRDHSPNEYRGGKGENYIQLLNDKKYAGYSDWRLPTLEEALTHLSPKRTGVYGQYNYFGENPKSIWTSDRDEFNGYYFISYSYSEIGIRGEIATYFGDRFFVRGVRSDVEKNIIPESPKSLPLLQSQKLSQKDVIKMLKKHNFYDSKFNITGKGREEEFNSHRSPGIFRSVIDDSLQLVWSLETFKEYSFQKALDKIDDLNREIFAGFENWYMPSLDELMNLVRKQKNNKDQHLPGYYGYFAPFPADQVWTRDTNKKGNKHWTFNFSTGENSLAPVDARINFLIVRKITEYEKAVR